MFIINNSDKNLYKYPDLRNGLVEIWLPGRDGYTGSAASYCINFLIKKKDKNDKLHSNSR